MSDESANHASGEDQPASFGSLAQRRLEGESAGLAAALGEQLRNAPWYIGSVGIHLVVFAVLMLIPSAPPSAAPQTVTIEVTPVEEQEEIPEEITREDADIEMVEFPTEAVDLRPVDTNVDITLDTPVEDVAPVEMAADAVEDVLDFSDVVPATIAIRATTTSNSAFAKRNNVRSRVNAIRQHVGSRPQLLDQRVDDALQWLKAHQDNKGFWDAAKYGGGSDKTNCAVTSFATLAFLGAGNSPKSGKYRNEVRKSVKWLCDQQQKNGRIGPHSYVHGIALMAVTEAYGMSNDSGLKERAQRAIDYAVATQNGDGGWDYAPSNPARSDLSVAGWYIMGLKSGKQAGLDVPADAMNKALRFVELMTSVKPNPNNSFAGSAQGHYTSNGKGGDVKGGSGAMTAVSLTTLQFLERPRTDERVRLTGQTVVRNGAPKVGNTDFYRWYYGALGLFQYGGDPELRDDPTMSKYVEAWRKWCTPMVETLLKMQVREGSFRDKKGSWNPETERGHGGRAWGRVGQTAIAALMLEVFYRYDFVQQSRRAMVNS